VSGIPNLANEDNRRQYRGGTEKARLMFPKLIAIILVSGPLAGQQPEQQNGPFRLTITTEKKQYTRDEIILVKAVLKNVSGEKAYVALKPPAVFYTMDVEAPVDTWTRLHPRAALTPAGMKLRSPYMMSTMGRFLLSGAVISDEVELNKIFHMTNQGEYGITFSCRLPPAPGTSGAPLQVSSNKLVVTVRRQE
jgi:hypothetical protein